MRGAERKEKCFAEVFAANERRLEEIRQKLLQLNRISGSMTNACPTNVHLFFSTQLDAQTHTHHLQK